jgi:hypothetical protein
MIRESVRTALIFLLIPVCACSDDDHANADEAIPSTTLVAMSELHMNGALSYDFVLHQDSTAILGTAGRGEERWTVAPEIREKVLSATIEGGFARMKREYLDPQVSCGGVLRMSLNDGRFRKTVCANNADRSSDDVWKIAERVKDLLGLDAVRERLNQR